nr:hypothetical protein [Tanacetum cinerariifolium]
MGNFLEDIQCVGSEHHEVHEMHDDVQPNCVVVLDTEYTGNSNMIPYDQYVKDNTEPVLQNNASSVSNDASMIIINEMPELTPLKEHTKVVDASLTAELAIYKEQVELYKRQAKFELTVREQKIDEQLRIVITDRNIKEENLKKELHSIKFEKTCKTRITPTGLTEGVMCFEQTKNCYLTEVIPFFKTLKEHFEGIQKALTKEIKKLKAFFDELEAEVDKNAVNRKCDEIERKNLLIKNDTLIENCLSKEVFYIATNSELNVSRFSEMHDAHTVVQARCLELETNLSKLKDKIQKDDHDVMTTILLTENENLKVQINAKLKCVTIDSVTPKVLAPGMYAIDVEPVPPRCRNNREVHLEYLKHLKESVATIREIVEEAMVKRPLDSSLAHACLYTKRSQELVEYAVGTCPKDFNKRDKNQATTHLTKKKWYILINVVDEGEPAGSTALGATTAVGTRETTREPLKRSALSEQLPQEYGFVFRPHRFAEEFAEQISSEIYRPFHRMLSELD